METKKMTLMNVKVKPSRFSLCLFWRYSWK